MFQFRLLQRLFEILIQYTGIPWNYIKTLTATLRCGRMWLLHIMWVVQHPCVHRMHMLNKILLHGLLLSGIHWKLELNWPGRPHDYPGHFHHSRGRHASAWLQQNRGAQCAECIKLSFKPGKLPVDFVSRRRRECAGLNISHITYLQVGRGCYQVFFHFMRECSMFCSSIRVLWI